ncbi:peptide MFS transporter [Oceanobacillus bengalensis]|uniref:Peptide MFS transporter n=1 Tax=Oceanobacillus bengalensis TaxID=1435466 RepID=A0A494YS05_9BACI|nr:peptide MFS transporter [Oceanobacillus bengalensis]RKQ12457.1 peptide MFS transporter [Oceanobacillus bengalensis]
MNKHDKEAMLKTIPQKGFFGHPKGLSTLFFTEFWERFSYYGMRAILLFYMYFEVTDGGLGIDQTTANSIMAIYGSLVYMSGIIGGWIADRILGTARTVFYGGVLIMIGHVILALPAGIYALFISMIFIIIGTGLLKPNVGSMVGDLYSEKDPRRDSGFSIYYMGINMGAFIAPYIVGTIGETHNFHLGFSIAAVGMFIGLVVYVITRKKSLGLAGAHVPNPLTKPERSKTIRIVSLAVVIIALVGWFGFSGGWLTIDRVIFFISILGVIIPAVYFISMYRSPKTNAQERSRLLAYIPLFLAAMMFWAIQEQGSTILATYANERTQLDFLGIELKASWFQSLNPLFIIMLAPVFAWLWTKLGDRQPSVSQKFSFGLLFAGLSFLVMIFPALSGGEQLVSPLWLVLSFFLVVLGELLLSPVGLSATTKLAPAAFAAQMMSLWNLSNASAQAINAQVVRFYNPDTEVIYFGAIGGVAIVLGIILFMLSPKLKNFMQGIK